MNPRSDEEVAVTTLGTSDVLAPRAGTLCEGPVWDAARSRLTWVDILAGRVLSADADDGHPDTWELGTPVGAIALRAQGGWVAAVERGFVLYDADWAPVADVVPAPGQPEGTRFNDGKCDPYGRFWAGTTSYDDISEGCCLYRFDADGTVTEMLDGVSISNGLGWSPSGDTMYFADTPRGTVDAFRFDAGSGAISERRTLVAVPPDEGAPDGLTVDADGYLWVALWGGGAVRRYSPDGDLDSVVELPVSLVTSATFGGPAFADLFITTASEGLDDGDLAEQPLAGSVFRCRPGPLGLPPAAFAG
jgi:sugar lactone lactonase YvrE